MKYLGLDLGNKRTGVAFADSQDDILFSLETIHHTSTEELVDAIKSFVTQRQIDEVVLGLPLLLGGTEGAQATHTREVAKALEEAKIPYSLLDERYTSGSQRDIDKDAAAACQILAVKLAQKSDI